MYSVQLANTEPVPAGIGSVQLTIELYCLLIARFVFGSPPSKKRSEANAFCALQMSEVTFSEPGASCQSPPTPAGTRAEMNPDVPYVPVMMSPPNGSRPPTGDCSA